MIDDPRVTYGVVELDGETPPPTIDPFVALPALLAALRRGRRFLAVAAAAGWTAGILLTVVLSQEHTASTTLLLGRSAQLDPVRAMATDAQLIETRAVAQQVVDSLGLSISAQELIDDYEPVTLSTDLLRIRVRASDGAEAARRADAVASAFLAFRSDEFRRQAEVAVSALRTRTSQLEEELRVVNDRISGSGNATQPAEVQELGDLLVRRSTLNDQLASLRQRIEVTISEQNGLILRSRVVDEAAPDRRSTLRAAASNGVAGAIAGLLVASGFLILQEIAGDRVHRRSDIARLLGAPVAASTPARRRWGRSGPRHLRDHLAGGRTDHLPLVEHLREVVETSTDSASGVLLASVGSHGDTAWCAGLLTADLVRTGRSVLLVDALPGGPLAQLVPTVRDEMATRTGGSIVVLSYDQVLEDPTLFWRLRHESDAVVAVASVEPAVGAQHLRVFGAPVVVAVVTAGRPTSTTLRSTAELLDAAGLPLRSTIVVSADWADPTTGLLPRRTGARR